ncbi:MAG: DUF2802 domain-containing protein [Permianibacter sp.]
MELLAYVAVLSTGLAFLFAGLCLFLWRRVQRTESLVQELRNQHQQLADTAKVVGKKLVQLQTDLQGFAQKMQNEATVSASHHKAYSQAARMLQQGVSADEVMQRCNLSRGEAELLAVMTRAASGE